MKNNELTDEEFERKYTKAIPDECTLRTFKQHEEIILCWSLLRCVENGDTISPCGELCEFSKNFNQEKLMKLIKEDKIMKERSLVSFNTVPVTAIFDFEKETYKEFDFAELKFNKKKWASLFAGLKIGEKIKVKIEILPEEKKLEKVTDKDLKKSKNK